MIDHSIDIQNEPDPVKAFDLFIKKWAPDHYAHLIDSDDNDGEFMRQKIVKAPKRKGVMLPGSRRWLVAEINRVLDKHIPGIHSAGASGNEDLTVRRAKRLVNDLAEISEEVIYNDLEERVTRLEQS